MEYLVGCKSPFPRRNPLEMNLCSCRRLISEAFVWTKSIFIKIIIWVNIKTMIFHMANLITMLAFDNPCLPWKKTSKWNWVSLKKPNTLELNGIGVVSNMKWNILVISKTNYIHVNDKLFPRYDDQLQKRRINFCIFMKNSHEIGTSCESMSMPLIWSIFNYW